MVRLSEVSFPFLNAGDFYTGDDIDDQEDRMPRKTTKLTTAMIPNKRKSDPRKPTLVIVGESMVDPVDVAAIVKVRSKDDLYIIRLKSQPNAEYPFWASGPEIAYLLSYFNIEG